MGRYFASVHPPIRRFHKHENRSLAKVINVEAGRTNSNHISARRYRPTEGTRTSSWVRQFCGLRHVPPSTGGHGINVDGAAGSSSNYYGVSTDSDREPKAHVCGTVGCREFRNLSHVCPTRGGLHKHVGRALRNI